MKTKQQKQKYMKRYMKQYRKNHKDIVARTKTRYAIKKYIHTFHNINDLRTLDGIIKQQEHKVLSNC